MRTASEAYVQEQIAKGTAVATDKGIRMQGFVPHGAARGLDPNLDCDLITHVKDFPVMDTGAPDDLPIAQGELWQGGCMQGVALPDDFDFVLSLYPWEQYRLGPETVRIEVTMYDALDQGFEQVDGLADMVVGRLNAGEKVLVHCQAGLNRSGLLAATILVKMGSAPSDAIGLLRAQRSPLVLCNESFENWIAGLA